MLFHSLFFTIIIINKRLLDLDVVLKKTDDYYDNDPNTYELQLKVGLNKKYVLKKHINDFFDAYNEKHGEVEFGKNFIYNAESDYFNEIDACIIEFANVIINTREGTNRGYGFYSYYQKPSTTIKLSGGTLKQLFKLLKNKPFTIEVEYSEHYVKEIIENDGM